MSKLEQYEQSIMCFYLYNALRKADSGINRVISEFVTYVYRNSVLLGVELPDELVEHTQDFTGKRLPLRVCIETKVALIELLEPQVARLPSVPLSELEKTLRNLSDIVELDPLDHRIFGFFVRMERYKLHEDPFAYFRNCCDHARTAFACILDMSISEITKRIHLAGELYLTGLFKDAINWNHQFIQDTCSFSDQVLQAIEDAPQTRKGLRAALLGASSTPRLRWDDFAHIAELRDNLAKFLQHALQTGERGINILLYGPPGTGKTEICKSLAKNLHAQLYPVMEMNNDGEEPNRNDRLSSYRILQRLLSKQQNSLIMFDEIDDVFSSRDILAYSGKRIGSLSTSKVYMNRLLEGNRVPTFWIINDVSNISSAIIRRMTLAVEMPVPPIDARQKIWKRITRKRGITLTNADATALAAFDASPAIAESATIYAKAMGNSLDDFRFATFGLLKAMHGKEVVEDSFHVGADHYLPQLVHHDSGIAGIESNLSKLRQHPFSLCLYGAPGTGKTAYVRHLAKQLGMPVLQKRASDLLGMFVGETEKQISEAFREAANSKSFLVFDEADSFLADRRHAVRQWEVSQVNEMLTWMERHPLPFACTTNLIERIDPASLRRFTFKCRFDFMKPEQVKLAFRHFFRITVDDRHIRELTMLTPGDFALVQRKAELTGAKHEITSLVALLKNEMVAKQLTQSNPIGF
ncbi:AAA family ATPase [Chrysiogenes arsenatis]|uniref:AAA family ATPase n=1 Tax=Chrysiogenes arsenatis TaxID=309797 RepID=UPI0004028453|nr:AAA family ATPase [Chrysiogenes arsenatis]